MNENSETVSKSITDLELGDLTSTVQKVMKEGEAGVQLAGLGLDGEGMAKSVKKAIDNALSISLFDALMTAWKGISKVRTLTGEKGPMDGKTRVCGIAEHSIKITHRPTIHITIGEAMELKRISLPVTLAFKIGGIALQIKDREICCMSAGFVDSSVQIFVEKIKVIDRQLPTIDLSKQIAFQVSTGSDRQAT